MLTPLELHGAVLPCLYGTLMCNEGAFPLDSLAEERIQGAKHLEGSKGHTTKAKKFLTCKTLTAAGNSGLVIGF